MAVPDLERQRVTRALTRVCDKVPLHVRSQLSHHFRFVGSAVELFERRTGYSDENGPIEHIVAKFRYNARRDSWTLYWSDRNLKWHEYEGFKDRRNVLELIAEVERDPTHIFFG